MQQQKEPYAGRFSRSEAPKEKENPAKAQPRTEAPRKPSGFSGAGKKARPEPRPAAAPEKKKAGKIKLKKEKQEKAPRKRSEKKPVLKRALIAAAAAVLIALLLIVIFGNHGTYHMMPTITREEAQPSFEPEKTPMPGVQEAI